MLNPDPKLSELYQDIEKAVLGIERLFDELVFNVAAEKIDKFLSAHTGFKTPGNHRQKISQLEKEIKSKIS